jgi:uncharacterized membrane protein
MAAHLVIILCTQILALCFFVWFAYSLISNDKVWIEKMGMANFIVNLAIVVLLIMLLIQSLYIIIRKVFPYLQRPAQYRPVQNWR